MSIITTKRVGGIRFVKIGNLGMSFWRSKPKATQETTTDFRGLKLAAIVMLAIIGSEIAANHQPATDFDRCIEQLAEGNPAVAGCRGG